MITRTMKAQRHQSLAYNVNCLFYPEVASRGLKTDVNSPETIVTPKRKLKAMFVQNFVGKTNLYYGERESRK